MKNYQSANDKSIIEVKTYLLNNLSIDQLNNYASLINRSYSIKDLKNNINKNKKIQLAIFSMIKCRLNATGRFDELEEELIYLNLLIDRNFKPCLDYKFSLTSKLISSFDFDENLVMIIRHLVKYKISIIDELVDYFGKRQNINALEIERIKIKVFLIEGEPGRAFKAVRQTNIANLGIWSKILQETSPIRYAILLKKQQKNRPDKWGKYARKNVLHR